MNEGQLTDLVMERKDISPMTKIVLRAIIRRVDWKTWTSKQGHKNVSIRELAKRCGTSNTTVVKSIARLEKAGLIERDFFKATKTQAPPIKVNVENIIKGVKESLTGGVKESLTGEVKKVKQSVKESLTGGVKESLTLSIKDNSNTIKKQYINTSLSLGQECIEAGNGMANDWGVANVELWGNHLHNDLIINLHNQTDSDIDTDNDKDN